MEEFILYLFSRYFGTGPPSGWLTVKHSLSINSLSILVHFGHKKSRKSLSVKKVNIIPLSLRLTLCVCVCVSVSMCGVTGLSGVCARSGCSGVLPEASPQPLTHTVPQCIAAPQHFRPGLLRVGPQHPTTLRYAHAHKHTDNMFA